MTLEQQAKLVNLTRDAIIVREFSGTILFWNRGAEQSYGWTKDEVLGKNAATILRTLFPRPLGEIEAELLRKEHWEGELSHTKRQGATVVVASRWTLQRDARGNPAAIVEIDSDVTARDEAERRFRALFDAAPDAMIVVDREGAIVQVNAETETLFGYRREELVGQSLELLVPARFRDGHRARRNQFFSQPRRRPMAAGLDLRALRKDGHEFPVEISLSPLDKGDGMIVLSAIRDVSERKRAEEAVRESEEHFRSLADSSPVGIFRSDVQGRCLYVNPRWQEIGGLSPEESLGYGWTTVIHPGDREALAASWKESVRNRLQFSAELRLLKPREETGLVRVHASPIRTASGEIRGYVGTIEDITERKQFEEALRQKNAELENAILAKDGFLAGMSHELRTPLNAIIGFTGTLLMKLAGPLTDEQTKQLQTVRSSAKHLLSLINDLLDLAKIGSGKVTLNPERVALQDLVQEVSSTLRPLADNKSLELKLTVPEEQLVLTTDRRALSQILLNLGNNAIKFTEHGEVSIVLTREQNGGKFWTQFSVHDTGIGIRPENQQRLFQAFGQVENNSRFHEGTGLGLNLSQKLAKLLGGQITYKSEFGKGSTFTLHLPES